MLMLYLKLSVFKKDLKSLRKKIPLMKPKEPLPRDLFNILACPICKTDLKYTIDKKGLVCTKCKHVYPIKEGIPILLPPKEK